MSSSLFIFGLGYSSAGVARQAQQQDWRVTSTARSPARFAPLQTDSHRVVRFDPAAGHPLDPDSAGALASAKYVLTSIPPLAATLYDVALAAQHRAIRQAAEAGGQPALGYLSSTGVYGDWGGDWVDESSETKTATARGLLRLEAEQAWVRLAQQLQLPLTIFRLGGIYGPRRSVLTNLQSQGPARPSAARRGRQRFTSRCHVADVAQAVLADMARRRTQQDCGTNGARRTQQDCGTNNGAPLLDVINVVDDEPAPRGDVEAYAQSLLVAEGVSARGTGSNSCSGEPVDEPPRQQQQQQQSRAAASRGAEGLKRSQRGQEPLEEKRVRNVKLKQLLQAQLGPQGGLVAPTYREGLTLTLRGVAPFEQQDLDCLYRV